MRLSFKDAVTEIKNRLDILSVIQDYLSVKRSGSSFVTLCPFHNDKSPSMNINPNKGIYKCFSCGAGGDMFKFLMEFKRISFSEAVGELAKKCNIEIIANSSPEEASKEPIYRINEIAKDFYKKKLSLYPNGFLSNYLISDRKLSQETIELFELGESSRERDSLLCHIKNNWTKFDDIKILKESGLFIEEDDGRLKDRFRGRLMIPIKDTKDRVIGFGARTLSSEIQPKYLNSPETAVYKKSENLFAMNFAKEHCKKEQKVLLLEGYFDVMKAHQCGIKYAVASLGTALTEIQASLLYASNLSRNIILGFDNDAAGTNALKGSLKVFQRTEVKRRPDIKVLLVKDAKDLDEYLSNVSQVLPEPEDAYEFVINKLTESVRGGVPEDRASCMEELADLMKDLKDPVYKEILAELCARKLSFTKQTVMSKFAQSSSSPILSSSSSSSLSSPTSSPRSFESRKNKASFAESEAKKSKFLSKAQDKFFREKNLLSVLFLGNDKSDGNNGSNAEIRNRINEVEFQDEKISELKEYILSLDEKNIQALFSGDSETSLKKEELKEDLKDVIELAKINSNKPICELLDELMRGFKERPAWKAIRRANKRISGNL